MPVIRGDGAEARVQLKSRTSPFPLASGVSASENAGSAAGVDSELETGNRITDGVDSELVTGNRITDGVDSELETGNRITDGVGSELVTGNRITDGVDSELVTGNRITDGDGFRAGFGGVQYILYSLRMLLMTVGT